MDVITEVGISTIDTSVLKTVGTGPAATPLNHYINARHLRVQEKRHLVNKRYLKGCPDKFDFGKSEWISQTAIVASLNTSFIAAQKTRGSSTILPVLVGHDVDSDIKFMRKCGFDVLPLISDCIDTQIVDRAVRCDQSHRGLSSLLKDQGIAADHLHNAGNDAHYTLYALLAMAVSVPKSRQDRAQDMLTQIEEEQKIVELKVRLQHEDWSSDEEDTFDDTGRQLTMQDLKQKAIMTGSGSARGAQVLPNATSVPSIDTGSSRGGREGGGRQDRNAPVHRGTLKQHHGPDVPRGPRGAQNRGGRAGKAAQ